MPGISAIRKHIAVFIAILIAVFILYFPILDNTFLSDDYDAIYRTTIEGKILMRNFLRPINDISVYFNYLLFGPNATGYYVFNLLIHAVNAWLLYRYCLLCSPFQGQNKEIYSGIVIVLFLFYPYHTESIVWLSGRLSTMACFFMLVILNVMRSSLADWKKKTIAAVCYIVGLHAYEAILLLPVIVVIFQRKNGQPIRSLYKDIVFWTGVMLFYFIWRYYILGILFGSYETRLFQYMGGHFTRAFKTLGRTLLPPSNNPIFLTLLFGVLIVVLLFLHYKMIKKLKNDGVVLNGYYQSILAFFTAILIPALFGISTNTSEGDRLLYIPSVFLCMIIAFMVVILIQSNLYRIIVLGSLTIYSIVFALGNIKLWERASDFSSNIIETVKENRGGNMLLINIPEETDGAFVFQNCFYRALIIHGIDTAGIKVNNYIKSNQCATGQTVLTKQGSTVFIGPETSVIEKEDKLYVESKGKDIKILEKKNSRILYWDCTKLVRLF